MTIIASQILQLADYTVYKEPPYLESKNIRNYFKLEKLGKNDEISPNYRHLLNLYAETLSFDNTGIEEKIVSWLQVQP